MRHGRAFAASMPDDAPAPLLSPSQRKLVGGALAVIAFVAIAALVVIAVIAAGQLLAFFSGVLWPLAAAGILVTIASGLYVIHREHRAAG